jgi:hypothetical protein
VVAEEGGRGVGRTVSLSDLPIGVLLLQIVGCLAAQWCCAGEDLCHAAEIECVADRFVFRHGDDDWWDLYAGTRSTLGPFYVHGIHFLRDL